jgi:hypothetical protein
MQGTARTLIGVGAAIAALAVVPSAGAKGDPARTALNIIP